MNPAILSVAQLKRAVVVKEQIEKLEAELERLLGSAPAPATSPKARRMSAAGRAAIAAAARKRWAKFRQTPKPPKKKKFTMSAAAKAAISRAAKARWAKIKAAKHQ